MIRLLTPERVLAHLRAGRTVAQVEQFSGWPAHVIRRLIARQPEWLLGADGRIYAPADADTGPAYLAEVTIAEPRPSVVLFAELKAEKQGLGLPWRDVLEQMQISESSLDQLRRGKASTRTRQRIEAWLVYTARQRKEAA